MCIVNKRSAGQEHNDKPFKIARGMALNMIKHVFLVIRSYLEMFMDVIFSFIWDGKRQAIPDLNLRHRMLSESAVTLAAKIRNKELKSADLVGACIERIKAAMGWQPVTIRNIKMNIEAQFIVSVAYVSLDALLNPIIMVNPLLNAVTDERFANALQEAAEVDKMIESGLPDDYFKQKPFLGVPFTAKESHAVAGMLHTLGVTARAHTRAEGDAECVRLLRAAGAIPVAVTNVPEINKWQESRNMVFGQTNNPYHTGRTTGGSSGGEAALAAALASPISLCSDIGGSTRMPAFYCGLFGLNCTAGHTSLKGSALRSGLEPTMASIGFVSKHAEDLAPLTAIVAGEKAAELNLDRQVDIKDMKFFFTETARDLRVSSISSDLRQAMFNVVKRLSEEATSTSQVPAPYYHAALDHMFLIWKHAMSREAEDFGAMLTNNTGRPCALTELAKKMVGMSQYTMAAILKLVDDQLLPKVNAEWAENITQQLKDDLIRTLGTNGVLIFPSAPAPAPYHYSLLLRPFNFAYWGVFNALHFPAVQVPLGVNADGIPLGVQIVAAPKQDALCVAAAKHFQTLFGGYVPPCKVY